MKLQSRPLGKRASWLRCSRANGPAALSYTAVIPTKDRRVRVEAAVAGLLAQSRLPALIIVVDASASPLNPVQGLRDALHTAGVDLLILRSSPSTSGQRNHGVEHVQTPLVLLLDDDVSLQADYAEVLLERWQRDGLHAFGALVGAPLNEARQGWLPRLTRLMFMLHYQALRSSATSFRRSRKLRIVPVPETEVLIPACGAGYGFFRTDLLRRHPFDERFPGYAPGEDLDMSSRLSADAPILLVPSTRWAHDFSAHERVSVARWRQRGRTETYFRLRHLERSRRSHAAFALSLFAEAGIAATYSLRHRGRHVTGYLGGVLETLRERDYRYEPLQARPAYVPQPQPSQVPAASSERNRVSRAGSHSRLGGALERQP